jgi:hypothetical protein
MYAYNGFPPNRPAIMRSPPPHEDKGKNWMDEEYFVSNTMPYVYVSVRDELLDITDYSC